MKFQKNIFICWYQGRENLNKHSKANIFNENLKNWEILNPTWSLHFISNKELRNACKKFSKQCLKLYDSFDLIHLKIDLGRYVLLYLYGGIYVDMDMYILRGLHTSRLINNLIKKANNNNINVLGLSSLNLESYEGLLFIGQSVVLNNAMMFSTPKHPLLHLMIKTINSHKYVPKSFNSFTIIQNITGPKFINNFFYTFIDNPLHLSQKSHIEIFTHHIFEPSPAYGYSDITDKTLAIHKMELSWISPNIKNAIYIYYKFKLTIFILFIFFIIYYIKS